MNEKATKSSPLERPVGRHTPGPWALGKHGVIVGGKANEYVNGSAQAQLAMVTLLNGTERDDPVAERDANAHLISAAPELLTALIELRDWYAEHTKLPACNANAAIAKAIGWPPNP